MGLPVHTVNQGKGSTGWSRQDEVTIVLISQLAYAAASGAGTNVTVAVSGLSLPATYSVFPGDLGQAGDVFITNRTATGFTVNIAPPSAGVTLAAGHVDLKILH